ncbi:MAG: autorepressor SdpR family transcription factor [Chitinophagaceae bacterium]
MNIVFKALNDESRRTILELLQQGDLSAGAIAAQFDMTPPSVSHHLNLLKQANLVTTRKEGQFIYYSLNTTVID